jgi:uncharacterized protein (TIGR02594 family)
MNLPVQYKYLEKEDGPKMLLEALKLYGIKEQLGNDDNADILSWANETGLARVYSSDSIPWCGLFIAVVAKRAGKEFPPNPLWALNWAKFGHGTNKPMLGDVVVFKRPTGGHVALYAGEDRTHYHVLGGNQSDAVTITRIAKNRAVAFRRAVYSIGVPANVRKIELAANGPISANEA